MMQVSLQGASGPGCPRAADVVVLGAGAAGLYTALFAALDGASVLVVEHTDRVGGSSAYSAGTTWVPLTHHSATVNPSDTLATVETYLDHAVGDRAPRALRSAFLRHGAAAVKRLEQQTPMRFRPYVRHPDYISDLPGASLCGRALEPLPFDARTLGPLYRLVREPIPEFTVLGGMMVDRTDILHLLGATQRWSSFCHAVSILTRHAADRLRHPRGMRWVMGNALIGRLLASLQTQPAVSLCMNTSVQAIERGAAGNVSSVVLERGGARWQVQARGGVVLATGGFNRDPQLRAQWLGPLVGANPQWCPGAPGHTGEVQALARALGARHTAEPLVATAAAADTTPSVSPSAALSPAMWAPVSMRTRPDGSTAVFPHFVMDRAKPGVLAVDAAGRRFVNESTSYHLFALAMQAAHQQVPTIPAFLIADARALRAYGLGMVRPGGKGLEPFLADGYLVQGDTLAQLAQKLGIDPNGLAATVARFNGFARTGVDEDFHRGETAYQHNIGDATLGLPNPNLGELREAPFYALRLYPGDIGAADGFDADENARVLDTSGQVIDGLYAVGNDLRSIMGGVYPAPGITLGPALVFGSLAAAHAAGRAQRAAA